MKIKSVTETVLHDLRIRIIVGALEPGSKLKEEDLLSRYGVSNAPLREAYRLLESEHLVVYYPRKGFYVTDISFQKCQELYQIRTMIEGYSVELLKQKRIDKLPKVAAALEASNELKMPPNDDIYKKFKYLKSIADFHIKLVEAAGNSQLAYFYHSIVPNLARYQSIYTYISGLMNQSYAEHKQFLELIENREYEKAKDFLKFHINKFVKIIEENVNKSLK